MFSWVGLVSKNYEIECAIAELEKELIEIKMKKNNAQATNVMNIGAGEENTIDDNNIEMTTDQEELNTENH